MPRLHHLWRIRSRLGPQRPPLLVSLFVYRMPRPDERELHELAYPVIWAVTTCAGALLFGWLWRFAL